MTSRREPPAAALLRLLRLGRPGVPQDRRDDTQPRLRLQLCRLRVAEVGCPHAPHPWLLSIGNSLLCGRSSEALEHLRRTRLDNGIACESVDEHTGECTTGEAFATCAGFICHALRRAIGGERREG